MMLVTAMVNPTITIPLDPETAQARGFTPEMLESLLKGA